jgi:tetratricopeptide (TPR) repeat protein
MTGTTSPHIPSLVPGVDIYSLPITSIEAFVMSRIDGVTTVQDISFLCGIAVEEAERVLERLVELGAIRWVDGKRASDNVTKRVREPKITPKGGVSGKQEVKTCSKPLSPSPGQSDEKNGEDKREERHTESTAQSVAENNASKPDISLPTDEEVDLSVERRKQILEAFSAIDNQNHYQALGVPQDADKERIRTAYFELSKVFHTDSVFGKRLGNYRSKMEAVFKRITQAYEVLGKKKKRQEYDEYLAAAAQTLEVERLFTQMRDQRVSIPEELTPIGPVTMTDSSDRVVSPVAQPPESNVPLEPNRVDEENQAPSFRPSLTPDERRSRKEKVVRMRLGAVRRTPVPSSATLPASAPSSAPRNKTSEPKIVRDSLIRNLASSLEAAARATGESDPASKCVKEAKKAEEKGDLIEAAVQLQLAMTFARNREEISAEYERVRLLVAACYADKFEKQAKYEEKAGIWRAAAQSWMRVCDGRPTEALPALRAAEALLKEGDLRSAQKMAQKAVDVEPNNVSNLLVLVRVYLALGLKLNARRELEKAAKLDPKDKIVNDLFKEVR